MLRYHLARILRLPLLVVLVAFIVLTVLLYRPGGAEALFGFGYFRVLLYWSMMGPLLLLGLAASTPPTFFARVESDPLVVARPCVGAAIRDSLMRIAALLMPVLLCGIVASLFLSRRVPDAAKMVHHIDVRDPVNAQAIWLVFLIGPLTGSAMLLAVSDVVGTLWRSQLLRVVIVGMVALMDMINRIDTPWLSPSGTTLSIAQTACTGCGPITQMQGTLAGREGETYLLQPASWGNYLYIQYNQALEPLEGPFSTTPAMSLLIARITLMVLAIALMIGIAVWRVRKLQRTLM